MASGKIIQIIGPVIDVEFPRESIPQVYEALKLADVDLTLEVQQQLGDGVVRAIAKAASAGWPSMRPASPSTCPWARPPWAASWTCWVRRRTTAARLPQRRPCP